MPKIYRILPLNLTLLLTEKSQLNPKVWSSLRHFRDFKEKNDRARLLLVANKVDVPADKKAVSTIEGRELATEVSRAVIVVSDLVANS